MEETKKKNVFPFENAASCAISPNEGNKQTWLILNQLQQCMPANDYCGYTAFIQDPEGPSGFEKAVSVCDHVQRVASSFQIHSRLRVTLVSSCLQCRNYL